MTASDAPERQQPSPLGESEPTLREVVESLATLERPPGSPGEEQAARWLAQRLEQAGCEVSIDPAEYHDGYAQIVGRLSALGAAGGLLALRRGGRALGGLLAAGAAALIADDISNGPRVVRRAAAPRQTQNVVAVCGDVDARRTLVVLGHHDAALTGAIFDDRLQHAAGELFPGVLERIDTSVPLWWAVLAGPAAVALGALRGRRGMVRTGIALSAISTAVFADIARSPTVPGANDNLSAIAVMVALAERLRDEPLEGLKVMLVSCGAEEVIQGGIYSFAERHFPSLDRERTWFLDLDSVGSPELVLVEGEGPVVMEDYPDRRFRDLIARVADRAGAPVRRGMRARNSTDAVVPARAGYPTALLVSMDRAKALSNYHQMTDTPDNLEYRTLAHALLLVEETARELAVNPWIGG
jgi:Zn-dependent M28 family amino/carboxypeptidase